MTTFSPTTWLRVKKGRLCPVCGKDSWCTVSADGKLVICPRTPSKWGWKGENGGGYLHKLDGEPLPAPRQSVPRERPAPALTPPMLEQMAATFCRKVDPGRLADFAGAMGLGVESLMRLEVGWLDSVPMWSDALQKFVKVTAWSFPMRDPCRRVTGLRLRTASGRKFSFTGGREGLFIPTGLHWAGQPLLACEGPTSTAALLDMGFDAIGRPSCSGGVELLIDYLRHGPKRDVVVLGDHDERKQRPDGSGFYPGQDGAEKAACRIVASGVARTVKVLVPPFCKDARDWKLAGATRATVEAVIRAQTYWRRSA